jgi:hypothetical protein
VFSQSERRAMTKVITGADALNSLRLQVAGRKGYIYKREERERDEIVDCLYVEKGCPSCLVGQSFHYDFGVSIPDLELLNSNELGEHRAGDASVGALVMPEGVELTKEARQIFGAAQEVQDSGGTWGAALEAAEVVAASLGVEL